jgi:hypothetical protein
MRPSARATLGLASYASLVAATCAGSAESPVGIVEVRPAAAYNNGKIDLVIQGGPFRPAYDIDTGEGRAATQMGAFTAYLTPRSPIGPRVAFDSLTWLNTTALAASLRAGVPPGVYDVEVLDPRGTLAELPEGFVSLGRDEIPPIVTILEPEGGTVVNPSAEVPVAFSASDAPGTLRSMTWTVSSPGIAPLTGSCDAIGPADMQRTCRFVFVVPQQLPTAQVLNVNVAAKDAAGNDGFAVTTLAVGRAPKITSFSPEEGPAQGGTEIKVIGDNFLPGTQVLVGGLPIEPGGGTVVDEHLIVGTTPAHDAGVFPVVVRTGGLSVKAPKTFHFVGAPLVLAVSPTSGPPAGGTPVTIVGRAFREETKIRFGSDFGSSQPLLCPILVGPNRIQGYVPAGVGAVSIFAADPVSGTAERVLAYTYLSEDSPPDKAADASVMEPPCLSADGGVP